MRFGASGASGALEPLEPPLTFFFCTGYYWVTPEIDDGDANIFEQMNKE
jgi:hypothetical protein